MEESTEEGVSGEDLEAGESPTQGLARELGEEDPDSFSIYKNALKDNGYLFDDIVFRMKSGDWAFNHGDIMNKLLIN